MRKILLIVIALLLSLQPSHSLADGGASVSRSNSITTASWSVAIIGQGQAPSFNPYLLTWNITAGTAYNYFSYRNLGSITLSSFTTTISQTRVGGGPKNDVIFEQCVGGSWNFTTNACVNGTILFVGQGSDQSIVLSNSTLALGAEIQMRARTPARSANIFTTLLSTQVSRGSVRPPLTINS